MCRGTAQVDPGSRRRSSAIMRSRINRDLGFPSVLALELTALIIAVSAYRPRRRFREGKVRGINMNLVGAFGRIVVSEIPITKPFEAIPMPRTSSIPNPSDEGARTTMLLQHRATGFFPDMSAEEYLDLKRDIKAHGLKVPILLWGGQLIDGWHRLKACQEVGVKPRFEDVYCHEEELPAFVWSLNAVRRQLTTGQKAMIGARMSERSGEGRPKKALPGPGQDTAPNGAVSQSEAATLAGVSRRHVQRAAEVLKEDGALAAQVHSGEITISKALCEIEERKTPPAEEPPRDQQNLVYRELLEQALKSGEQIKAMLERATSHARPENWEDPAVTDAVAYAMEGRLKRLLGSICEIASQLGGARPVGEVTAPEILARLS